MKPFTGESVKEYAVRFQASTTNYGMYVVALETFFSVVEVPLVHLVEAKEWCSNNIGDNDWLNRYTFLIFTHPTDAVIFKLNHSSWIVDAN